MFTVAPGVTIERYGILNTTVAMTHTPPKSLCARSVQKEPSGAQPVRRDRAAQRVQAAVKQRAAISSACCCHCRERRLAVRKRRHRECKEFSQRQCDHVLHESNQNVRSDLVLPNGHRKCAQKVDSITITRAAA